MKKTSVYLEPDLDAALALRAAEEGISKAALIRRTLAGAVERPKRPRPSVGAVDSGARGRVHATIDEELAATGFGGDGPRS